MKTLLAALAALFAAGGASAADIVLRAAPADFVYLYDANPRRGYVDTMVQTIVVTNSGRRDVDLTGLEFEYLRAGDVLVRSRLPAATLVAGSREYAEMLKGGFDAFLRLQLLREEGQAGSLSSDTRLQPGETLLATGVYQALGFEPDEIRVTARYRRKSGPEMKTSLMLGVRRASSSIDYRFPLEGGWLMRSLPSLQGHHRSIPSNEFALDFFKPGAEGKFAEGDSRVAENNFGYGAPVRAAAAGEVVFVIADAAQDRTAFSRREGETREEAGRRIQKFTMGRIAENLRKALAGNIVTIRHQGPDGTVEYSSYAHMKTGSVRVKAGDTVSQGQIIGEVGDTGDSSAVHLHFQINEGPDAFFSRSKPVVFGDMAETFSGQDPGIFVKRRD